MKPSIQLPVILVAIALSGCTAGTGSIGTNAGFNDAEVAALAQENRVVQLQIDEGGTTSAQIPLVGSATYDGFIHGDVGGGSGPDLEYYADISVTANFATETLSGNVTNLFTDLDGFLAPTGSATLVGVMDNTVDEGDLQFDIDGVFVGTGATATYDTSGAGDLIGDTAQSAIGTHNTDFEWTGGPNIGTTSFSDGTWTGEQ